MAIQHTREVQRVECYPNGNIMVVYLDKFDDPDDDLLPTETNKVVHISHGDDISAHMPFVQDVCNGAWLNLPDPAVDPVDPVVESTEEPPSV